MEVSGKIRNISEGWKKLYEGHSTNLRNHANKTIEFQKRVDEQIQSGIRCIYDAMGSKAPMGKVGQIDFVLTGEGLCTEVRLELARQCLGIQKGKVISNCRLARDAWADNITNGFYSDSKRLKQNSPAPQKKLDKLKLIAEYFCKERRKTEGMDSGVFARISEPEILKEVIDRFFFGRITGTDAVIEFVNGFISGSYPCPNSLEFLDLYSEDILFDGFNKNLNPVTKVTSSREGDIAKIFDAIEQNQKPLITVFDERSMVATDALAKELCIRLRQIPVCDSDRDQIINSGREGERASVLETLRDRRVCLIPLNRVFCDVNNFSEGSGNIVNNGASIGSATVRQILARMLSFFNGDSVTGLHAKYDNLDVEAAIELLREKTLKNPVVFLFTGFRIQCKQFTLIESLIRELPLLDVLKKLIIPKHDLKLPHTEFQTKFLVLGVSEFPGSNSYSHYSIPFSEPDVRPQPPLEMGSPDNCLRDPMFIRSVTNMSDRKYIDDVNCALIDALPEKCRGEIENLSKANRIETDDLVRLFFEVVDDDIERRVIMLASLMFTGIRMNTMLHLIEMNCRIWVPQSPFLMKTKDEKETIIQKIFYKYRGLFEASEDLEEIGDNLAFSKEKTGAFALAGKAIKNVIYDHRFGKIRAKFLNKIYKDVWFEKQTVLSAHRSIAERMYSLYLYRLRNSRANVRVGLTDKKRLFEVLIHGFCSIRCEKEQLKKLAKIQSLHLGEDQLSTLKNLLAKVYLDGLEVGQRWELSRVYGVDAIRVEVLGFICGQIFRADLDSENHPFTSAEPFNLEFNEEPKLEFLDSDCARLIDKVISNLARSALYTQSAEVSGRLIKAACKFSERHCLDNTSSYELGAIWSFQTERTIKAFHINKAVNLGVLAQFTNVDTSILINENLEKETIAASAKIGVRVDGVDFDPNKEISRYISNVIDKTNILNHPNQASKLVKSLQIRGEYFWRLSEGLRPLNLEQDNNNDDKKKKAQRTINYLLLSHVYFEIARQFGSIFSAKTLTTSANFFSSYHFMLYVKSSLRLSEILVHLEQKNWLHLDLAEFRRRDIGTHIDGVADELLYNASNFPRSRVVSLVGKSAVARAVRKDFGEAYRLLELAENFVVSVEERSETRMTIILEKVKTLDRMLNHMQIDQHSSMVKKSRYDLVKGHLDYQISLLGLISESYKEKAGSYRWRSAYVWYRNDFKSRYDKTVLNLK